MKTQISDEHRRERWRRQRIRTATYAVISVLVLGTAGCLLAQALWNPEMAPMAGKVIDIAADMKGFNRKVVRVKVGEPVTVRLTSLDSSNRADGGGKHQWAVEELGVDIVAQPKRSSHKTFTPFKPGTYTFYCDICCGGRDNPSMSGELIVAA